MDSTLIFLIIGGSLGLTLLSPYVGLLIYIAFLYLRPSDLYPELTPYHITRVLAVVLMASYFIHSQRHQAKKISAIPQAKLIMILMGVILISQVNGYWAYTVDAFYEMAKNFIAFFLVVRLVNTESRLRGTIWVILLLNGILSFDAIQKYMAVGGMKQIGGFSGGYFGGQGDFALLTNLFIPLALLLLWGERKILMKVTSLLFVVLLVGAVVSTGSRGGGVITLATTFMLFIFVGFRSNNFSMKAGSVLLSVLMLCGVLVFGSKLFKARAASIVDYQNQYTAYARIDYWKTGVRMFLYHPLVGVGAMMFPDLYLSYGGWDRSGKVAHNTYITAASELGIGGLLCYIGLLWFTIKDNWKIFRQNIYSEGSPWMAAMGVGLLIGVGAFAVGSMFQTVLYYPIPYLLIGLSVAYKQLADQEKERKKTSSRLSREIDQKYQTIVAQSKTALSRHL